MLASGGLRSLIFVVAFYGQAYLVLPYVVSARFAHALFHQCWCALKPGPVSESDRGIDPKLK